MAQLDFLSTAFDPREWKEDSGRQLRLTIPENEGGDETSFPSPPRCTFFDDRDVPLNPPDTPLWRLLDLLDRQIRLDCPQDCLQLLHLLVGKEEQELKNVSQERSRP